MILSLKKRGKKNLRVQVQTKDLEAESKKRKWRNDFQKILIINIAYAIKLNKYYVYRLIINNIIKFLELKYFNNLESIHFFYFYMTQILWPLLISSERPFLIVNGVFKILKSCSYPYSYPF